MIVTFYCIEYFWPPVLFNYLNLVKESDFCCEVNVEEPKARVITPYTNIFKKKGTYFAVLRVTGDLEEGPKIRGEGQRNLARERVIVEK